MEKIIKNNSKINKMHMTMRWIKGIIRTKNNRYMKDLEEWDQMNKVHLLMCINNINQYKRAKLPIH